MSNLPVETMSPLEFACRPERYTEPVPGAPPPSSPAESVFRRLVLTIREFEAQLDSQHEVGGRLVSFGPVAQFHIVDIGYWGPDIITFDGMDPQGSRMRLVQNISQLNVLLVALPKQQPQEAPRRIGFELIGRDQAAQKAG